MVEDACNVATEGSFTLGITFLTASKVRVIVNLSEYEYKYLHNEASPLLDPHCPLF